ERLAVRERLDRRIAPAALAPPGAEQERQPRNVGVQLGRHAATVPRTRGTTWGYGVVGSSAAAASSSGVIGRSSTTGWSSPTAVLIGSAGSAGRASAATCS